MLNSSQRFIWVLDSEACDRSKCSSHSQIQKGEQDGTELSVKGQVRVSDDFCHPGSRVASPSHHSLRDPHPPPRPADHRATATPARASFLFPEHASLSARTSLHDVSRHRNASRRDACRGLRGQPAALAVGALALSVTAPWRPYRTAGAKLCVLDGSDDPDKICKLLCIG